MTFAKLAYSRRVLRALAGEKVAAAPAAVGGGMGLLGRGVVGAAKAVGKPLNWAWQKSMQQNGRVMGTVGLGLGALGAGALAKRAINQTRAAYRGFQPEVQAYTRQSPYEGAP